MVVHDMQRKASVCTTTRRDMAVGCLGLCPFTEFVALQSAVLSGETTHVTDVPVGDAMVLWHLPWPDMLSAELAWHNRTPSTAGASNPAGSRSAASAAATSVAAANPPVGAGGGSVAMPADGLLLHRKYRAEDEQLLYDVRCR